MYKIFDVWIFSNFTAAEVRQEGKTRILPQNHLNTPHIQVIGDLEHFWPKNCIFSPFLGHFPPINL